MFYSSYLFLHLKLNANWSGPSVTKHTLSYRQIGQESAPATYITLLEFWSISGSYIIIKLSLKESDRFQKHNPSTTVFIQLSTALEEASHLR